MPYELVDDTPKPRYQLTDETKPVSLKERAGAIPAGFNSAMASLAGLPVDFAANIYDLGKAGIGSGYSAITGKAPPSALEITPRSQVVGSGDWFRSDNGEPRAAYAVPRPEDRASRYLAAAGGAGAATLTGNPTTGGEAAMGLLSNLGGNVGGQTAAELTQGMDPTSQTLAAASGQMLGGAIPGMAANRIAQPMRNQLTPGQQQTVVTADANDIPLDTASRTGSTFMRRMRNLTNDNPFTAGDQKEFTDEQHTAINRSFLRQIGEPNETRATPDVMGRADARIGRVMNDVAARNPIQFDTQLAGDLQQVQRDMTRTVAASEHGPINENIQDILRSAQANGGSIPGPVYQKLRSTLQSLSANPQLNPVAGDLREALDDALNRSVRIPEDMDALQDARLQYRNMKTIESAISKDNEGNISPARVVNTLGTKSMGNRNRLVYGRGDQELPELARASNEILSQDPNSGTAMRLTGKSATGMMGGAAVAALGGHWLPAAGLATLGYGFPKAMQGVNNSQALGRYLSQGITPGALRDALQFPQSPRFRQTAPLNALIGEEEARKRIARALQESGQ